MLELPLAQVAHDRAAHRRNEPGLIEDLLARETTRVMLVGAGRVAAIGGIPAVLSASRAGVAQDAVLPDGTDGAGAAYYYLGEADGVSYVARDLPLSGDAIDGEIGSGIGSGTRAGGSAADLALHAGHSWIGLRELADAADPLTTGLAVEAVAMANWHAVSTCCPRCGKPTQIRQAGWIRYCPADDSDHYPRTNPAVIMSIVDDDDRLLLGRGVTWPEDRMSVLAGFVEPGESAEQAVVREAAEEAGIVVGHVEYRGSQAWPMPASIMLGFHARARTTELTADGVEMADVRWFTRAELTAARADGTLRLPGRISIARVLIENWLGAPL